MPPLAALTLLSVTPAHAFQADDPFYTPPPEIPTTPGTLIRATPAPDLLGNDWPTIAQRILYSSTRSDGLPVAVSGTIFEPTAPWLGEGPRPTIVLAPGTRGAGDACTPSRGFMLLGAFNEATGALGTNYELPVAYLATTAGVRVVMTDYVGLGTPGAHTYVNHQEEATAVLDAARVALRTTGAAPDSPLGLWGYSQGGGATAAAAELAATYAPELNLVGTYAGAPPAYLPDVVEAVDGNAIFGVLGMAVAGFAARNPSLFHDEIEPLLNEEGRRYFAEVPEMCIVDAVAAWGKHQSRELSLSGESFLEIARRSPVLWAAVNEHNLGKHAPTGPVMMHVGINDDTIPYPQVRNLAATYCGAGASVAFDTDPLEPLSTGSTVNHAVPMLTGLEGSFRFLLDRFNGKPVRNDCGELLQH